MRSTEKIKKILTIGLMTILCVVLFHFIYSDWNAVREAIKKVQPGYLLISGIFTALGTFIIALCWQSLLQLLGAPICLRGALKSYYFSILYKYIPGKVWAATFRILVAKNEGVPEGTGALGVVLESLLLIVSAGAVGGIAITQWHGSMPVWMRYLPLLMVFLILVLHPKILSRVIPFLARKFPSRIAVPDFVPTFPDILRLAWVYCGVWVCWGSGVYFLIKGFAPVGLEDYVPIVGGNTLAWLAGFVAVFSPAGMGVRELILTYIVVNNTSTGTAAMVAVLARLLTLLGEVSGAFLVGAFRNSSKDLDPKSLEC